MLHKVAFDTSTRQATPEDDDGDLAARVGSRDLCLSRVSSHIVCARVNGRVLHHFIFLPPSPQPQYMHPKRRLIVQLRAGAYRGTDSDVFLVKVFVFTFVVRSDALPFLARAHRDLLPLQHLLGPRLV